MHHHAAPFEHRIETRTVASRIQEPALEHVWIGKISALYCRFKDGDALVNLSVKAIQTGYVVPTLSIGEIGLLPFLSCRSLDHVVVRERTSWQIKARLIPGLDQGAARCKLGLSSANLESAILRTRFSIRPFLP